MIIDTEQLSAMLAERLGIERQEANEKLDELIRQIQQIGGEGEECILEGFGSFIRKGGDLSFVPSDDLKTEINHRYAGMKPIELMEGFEESGASSPGGTEENPDVKMFDEDHTSSPPEKSEEMAEDASPDKQEPSAESHVSKNEEQDIGTIVAEDGEEKTVYIRHQRSYAWLLVAVMILLALLAGWRLAYMEGWLNTNSDQQSLSNQPKANTYQHLEETKHNSPVKQDSSSQRKFAETVVDSEQARNNHLNQDSAKAVSSTSQKAFGLMGAVNDSLGRAYMIVVHSLRSEQIAVHEKDSLAKVGYRTTINRTTVNERKQYRVGLGQFETINDALDARNRLPKTYRNDNFITRIK